MKKRSALVISAVEKSTDFIHSGLSSDIFENVTTADSISSAKINLTENSFDVIIVNAPLPDEFGIDFAVTEARNGNGVLFIVKKENYEETVEKFEDTGVFCVSKPISKEFFFESVMMVISSNSRFSYSEDEGDSENEFEESKLLIRAKTILTEKLSMSESEAYKYIEDQAMNLCIKKKEVAKRIIMTYEI